MHPWTLEKTVHFALAKPAFDQGEFVEFEFAPIQDRSVYLIVFLGLNDRLLKGGFVHFVDDGVVQGFDVVVGWTVEKEVSTDQFRLGGNGVGDPLNNGVFEFAGILGARNVSEFPRLKDDNARGGVAAFDELIGVAEARLDFEGEPFNCCVGEGDERL